MGAVGQVGAAAMGDAPGVVIVEAKRGPGRRRWLEEFARGLSADARVWVVSCDFDAGGPWAGVNELFSSVVPEIQRQRPDLIAKHAYELIYLLPGLIHTLELPYQTLTEMAPSDEKVRNFAADRAFRIVHGLIDLLDAWKRTTCPDGEWVVACDDFDEAGSIGSRFFREWMRRRGEQHHARLAVAVEPGKGSGVREMFAGSRTEVRTAEIAEDVAAADGLDAETAARLASELEVKAGSELHTKQASAPQLVRLWRAAGNQERLLFWSATALDVYTHLGLYEDALRYSRGILDMAAKHASEHASDRGLVSWFAIVKLMNCYMGVSDARTAMELAEGRALEVVKDRQEWFGQLCYYRAMLNARYSKPRDLAKGEELLDLGLAAIEESELPEDQKVFQSVFNRNGVAMIRTFQGRFQDAIDLCRQGIERLNTHVSSEKHRLHRSVLVYNIAQVCASTGATEEAIEHYTAAMAMDPDYSEYFNERGNIYLRLNRLEEALADYLQAVELSPPYFEVFTNMGQCYRRMNRMEEALEAYSRALDLYPEQVLALVARAKAYEALGESARAMADYSAAIEMEPQQWDAIASRGVLHYEAGDLERALADFDAAVALAPEQADLRQNRATVLNDLGRYWDAAREIELALTLNPGEEDRRDLEEKLESILAAAGS